MKAPAAALAVLALGLCGAPALAQCDADASVDSRWRDMADAPRDRSILLGLLTDDGFRIALGHWEVRDDLGAGIWTPEDWWGAPPTHWADIPPPPCDEG